MYLSYIFLHILAAQHVGNNYMWTNSLCQVEKEVSLGLKPFKIKYYLSECFFVCLNMRDTYFKQLYLQEKNIPIYRSTKIDL